MTGPISPTPPPSPHFFSSQIGKAEEPLPQEQQDHLNTIIDRLNQIKEIAKQDKPQPEDLTDGFTHFDRGTTDFFTNLSHHSNIAFQKEIKDKFDTMLHRFLDDLDEIHLPETDKPQGMNSLRDMLSTYDPQKLLDFLKNLINSSQGADALNHMRDSLETFIQEIIKGFHLPHSV